MARFNPLIDAPHQPPSHHQPPNWTAFLGGEGYIQVAPPAVAQRRQTQQQPRPGGESSSSSFPARGSSHSATPQRTQQRDSRGTDQQPQQQQQQHQHLKGWPQQQQQQQQKQKQPAVVGWPQADTDDIELPDDLFETAPTAATALTAAGSSTPWRQQPGSENPGHVAGSWPVLQSSWGGSLQQRPAVTPGASAGRTAVAGQGGQRTPATPLQPAGSGDASMGPGRQQQQQWQQVRPTLQPDTLQLQQPQWQPPQQTWQPAQQQPPLLQQPQQMWQLQQQQPPQRHQTWQQPPQQQPQTWQPPSQQQQQQQPQQQQELQQQQQQEPARPHQRDAQLANRWGNAAPHRVASQPQQQPATPVTPATPALPEAPAEAAGPAGGAASGAGRGGGRRGRGRAGPAGPSGRGRGRAAARGAGMAAGQESAAAAAAAGPPGCGSKLQQATLTQALKRAAQHKRGGNPAAEDDEPGSEGAAGRGPASGGAKPAAAAAAGPAKRKRKSSTAAAAGGSGGASGGASGRGSKVARKAAAAAEECVQEATEPLDAHLLVGCVPASGGAAPASAGCLLDLSLPAVWQQLQRELAVAEAAVLGLLYEARAGRAVQFFSSLQALTKEQANLLRKAARKQAAAGTAVADAAEEGVAGLPGTPEVVGVAIAPVAAEQAKAGGEGCSEFFMAIGDQLDEGGRLAEPALQLLQQLLWGDSPCVCANAKSVLVALAGLGLQLEQLPSGSVAVLDPTVLGYLHDPQLAQDAKAGDSCYSLQEQAARHGLQQQPVARGAGPLRRLQQHMQVSLQLANHVVGLLQDRLPDAVIRTEMEVCAILAKMEVAGVGFNAAVLQEHRQTLTQRVEAIKARAAQLAGHEVNLASASQLAVVLYQELRLPPPVNTGGKGSAKTHLPTDEHALQQLAHRHELPSLVIEFRSITNVMNKWIDADWVPGAAAAGRVNCSWNQQATATGRLSSSGPNLQAVTKYTIIASAAAQGPDPEAPALLNINIRDAFVAPPGALLLSADYSQVELRLLAHFSGDPLLQRLLRQSDGDVFALIATAWMSGGAGAAAGVTPQMRERAKRVTYGIIYGITAFGLAQQLADQGVTRESAQGLIDSFLERFAGVRQFIASSLAAAQRSGFVSTLEGRRRPISGLQSNVFTQKCAAERKVANSIIQGSAADLIKLAMANWDAQAAPRDQRATAGSSSSSQDGPQPPSAVGGTGARLVAQIHDELLFEVDGAGTRLGPDGSVERPGPVLQRAAALVRRVMEGAVPLAVPLRVNISVGGSWGGMQALE